MRFSDTSLNYDYGKALAADDVPYGTKGFVVMHKGGDGSVFKEGQADIAGWPRAQYFKAKSASSTETL